MLLHALPSVLVVAGLAFLAAANPSAAAATVPETQPSVATKNTPLAARIEECDRKRTVAQNTIERLQTDLRTMQEALETPGMDSYIGPLLNERRWRLPEVALIEREIRVLRDEANAVQIRYLMLEDELLDLKGAAGEASQAKAAGLQTLKDDYKAYWRSLAALSALQTQLLAETQSFTRVIDEHSLWLPSARPLNKSRFPTSLTPAPGTWDVLGKSLRGEIRAHPAWYASVVLVLVIWAAGYGKARSRESKIQELVLHSHTDSFRLTTDAIGIAIYCSAALPALLWFCGGRIDACVPTQDELVYEFGLAIALALRRAALVLFFLSVLREICRPNGVAHVHFLWNDEVVRRLRRGLSWLIWIGVPAVFVANFSDYHPDPSWRESAGRLAGLVALIALAVFADQMLRPGRCADSGGSQERKPRQVRPREWSLYLAALAVPLAISVALLTTYPHTAGEIVRHIYRTLMLVVALATARSLILRFVRVSRDRFSIEQAKRDQAREAHEGGEATNKGDGQAGDEFVPSERTIDQHATTLLYWLVVLGMVVGAGFIWHDVFPAFGFLGRIALWAYSAEGGAPATVVHLSDLLLAVVATFMTVVIARDWPAVIETVWLKRLSLDNGARFAVVTIIRYAVVLVGVSVTLGAIGLGWSRIQWLAAGITVGLGFGLQEIFANFVSGLIILFERPVRIGDIVTVGGVDGKVTRIRVRATTIIDGKRRELIVPNKEFITGQIINWTLSDPISRVAIPIGIAYGSNTRLARDLLLRVAAECKHVLKEPAPAALLKSFGDSTLDFELGVCIATRDVYGDMIHELHTRIDDEFRQAGIEIAFPQRDIHIRSMPEELRPAQPGPGAGSADSPLPKNARQVQSGSD
jgi:potassium-dependent mechanosensitive channel